jgi:nitrogen-specific signal transduction histidine kinase/CheY-like chemotaxis protein
LLETSSVATDISERLKAEGEREKFEEELRQIQKMESIGTMAGGIAHDFNNILSAIMGYLELAKMQLSPESPVNNDLEEVFKASLRAKDLVQQILTFSRRTKIEKKPIKLNLLVKEGIKLIRASIPTTIEIRQQIPDQCPNVIADPTQIHQIVMNLCTNAYHAMRDSGGIINISLKEITIGSENHLMEHSLEPGPYLLLEISDTGEGIPAENLTKIFEPYFTTKEVNEGTGLGLSVIHGIVKSHHGHISTYSEVGKGTTFKVYLPAEEEDEEIKYQATDKGISGGSEKIILVDDEESLVKIGSKLLGALGYEVSAFTNSPEALQAFREAPNDYDLIITDMTMPVLTGAKLAQEAKRIRPDIPIILCSGFTENLNEESARKMGISAYLTKPVRQEDLANTIRRVLESDF